MLNVNLTVDSSQEEIAGSTPTLRAEVLTACRALRISQNAFARKAGLNPGLFSRVLHGKLTSAPAERKARRLLERLRRSGKLDGAGTGA